MQIYDLIMIVVLLAAMVFGAWKGFVWQIASLASLVVSYFVALRFSSNLAPYLSVKPPLNRFLAMFLIYVACGLLIWILFRLLSGLIDRVKLKEFDRQMGAVAGIVKGGLLCVAITFFALSLVGPPYQKAIMTSRSGYYIGYFIDRIDGIMPQGMHDMLHPYLDELDKQLEHDHVDSDRHDTDPQQPAPTAEPKPPPTPAEIPPAPLETTS
ncbi:MAG: CvpA family protein [Pirellulales bacterium]|jgi:membrane protein required for colicin V production|nr:CvpA family protein [Pirellulales bacterium]HJN66128.1 CvpA family protein [Pirellulales bacterium]